MKKYMALCVLASAVLLLFAGAATAQYGAQPYGSQPYGSPAPYGQPAPYGSAMQPGGMMPASVFAGLVAAYEEHARYWNSKGVALTPRAIVAQQWGVRYAQVSPDRLRVIFLPPANAVAGGEVAYVVDLTTFQIVERTFGR
jgi:preprotein translocase subunit Sec61beta